MDVTFSFKIWHCKASFKSCTANQSGCVPVYAGLFLLRGKNANFSSPSFGCAFNTFPDFIMTIILLFKVDWFSHGKKKVTKVRTKTRTEPF